jgi:hypothetical protein
MLEKFLSALKKSIVIESILALCVILWLVFSFENGHSASPDGELYHGLAHNLIDGDGYIDNIRNDFILPSVGHPLLILLADCVGITNPLTFARLLLFLSFIIAFFTTKTLNIPPFIRILALPLMYVIIPEVYDWGVEMSLFFSINLLLFCIVRFIHHYNIWTAVLVGLSLALNLIVRPIYSPLIYLCLLGSIILILKFKKRIIPAIISLLVGVVIINGVTLVSKANFGDKRLTSGTYSEIPLYCANNKYIDLQKAYWSSRWSEVSPEDYPNAIGPLQITTTWEDRADTLRKEVISFYKNHPMKAINGILWRSSKFTYDQPKVFGTILFFVWLVLSLYLLWGNRKKLFITTVESSLYWIGSILPIYTVAIVSLFVYVGERYNISTNLVFVLGILLHIPMLQNYIKHRKKENETEAPKE